MNNNQHNRRSVAETVGRLLTHYPTGHQHKAVRDAEMRDWVNDLEEFGPDLVDAACTEYRRSDTRKRPVPGEIRAIATKLQSERAERTQLEDQRRKRWPQWLEDIWGPEPDGPRRRAEFKYPTTGPAP